MPRVTGSNQERGRQTTDRRSPERIADALERRRRLFEERRRWLEQNPDYTRPEGVLREGRENQPRGDSIGRRSYPDAPPREDPSNITVGDSLPVPEDLFPEMPTEGSPEQGSDPLTASLFGGRRWTLILGAGALLGGILLYNQMSG